MNDASTPNDIEPEHDHEGPGYATPQAAIEEGDREELAYVMSLYVGTDVDAPDFVAIVDIDPDSDTYCEIVDRIELPNRGDELHHFGWNACSSSCHVEGPRDRPAPTRSGGPRSSDLESGFGHFTEVRRRAA